MPRSGLVERLLYRAVYRCKSCEAIHRVPLSWSYWVGSHVHCPQCGTTNVSLRKKPDAIDRMFRHPFSWMQSQLGARLYHCLLCRLQFYDLRQRAIPQLAAPSAPKSPQPKPPQPEGAAAEGMGSPSVEASANEALAARGGADGGSEA